MMPVFGLSAAIIAHFEGNLYQRYSMLTDPRRKLQEYEQFNKPVSDFLNNNGLSDAT